MTETIAHKALAEFNAQNMSYSWAPELQDPHSPAIGASGHISWFEPDLEPRVAGAAVAGSILESACGGELPLLTVRGPETADDMRLVESGVELFRAGVLPIPAGSFCVDADFSEATVPPGAADRVVACAEFLREGLAGEGRARLLVAGFFRKTESDPREPVWDVSPGCAAVVEESADPLTYENDLLDDARSPEHVWMRQNALIRTVLATLALMASPDAERIETPAPAKLNRKREAKGRVPIPARTTVRVNPERARAARESAGGTHASPRPHFRRGHVRTRADGRKVMVAPTLVGVAPEERERMKSEIPAPVYDVRT